MRTAEIHFEEGTWATLQSLAVEQGVGVPELIRAAVEEKYLSGMADRVAAFRTGQGPWKDREDTGDSSEYVRQLRTDNRLDRLYVE